MRRTTGHLIECNDVDTMAHGSHLAARQLRTKRTGARLTANSRNAVSAVQPTSNLLSDLGQLKARHALHESFFRSGQRR